MTKRQKKERKEKKKRRKEKKKRRKEKKGRKQKKKKKKNEHTSAYNQEVDQDRLGRFPDSIQSKHKIKEMQDDHIHFCSVSNRRFDSNYPWS
jgi:hypothetical protein